MYKYPFWFNNESSTRVRPHVVDRSSLLGRRLSSSVSSLYPNPKCCHSRGELLRYDVRYIAHAESFRLMKYDLRNAGQYTSNHVDMEDGVAWAYLENS